MVERNIMSQILRVGVAVVALAGLVMWQQPATAATPTLRIRDIMFLSTMFHRGDFAARWSC